MSVHLVSSIETRDFGAETVRVGDLNGDGAPDLLFVQSVYGSREIRCLTATTILGERLWQTGKPSEANGRVYSDLPVQVYDWDNDGINEVLYVRQAEYVEPIEYGEEKIRERANRYEGNATMVVLDGNTGREKTTFSIPAPADDSFLFADLTGRGRREDFVVKDRYWTMWGISHTGDTMWRWEGSPGHYPAVADVDGDGRDEVFVGYALVDHDGKPLFQKDWGDSHQDAAYIARLQDGTWRLLFGNHGVHCLAVDGTEIWHHPLREAQHVVAGRYRLDSSLQVAVIDRGYPRTAEGCPATLYLFDVETGREVWHRKQPKGGWIAACLDIRWTGLEDQKEIMVYERGAGQPVAIYDGCGNILDEMDVPPSICSMYNGNPGIHICYRADVCGDSRQEVILAGWKGVRVFANARPLSSPTLYNNTLYHGM
jgi:outer membrane protein assembly factor BamB